MIEKKSKLITCRLTKREHKEYLSIFKLAKTGRDKYTSSDFIRDCIFNKELPKDLTIVRVKTPSRCQKQRLRILISIVEEVESIAISLLILRKKSEFNLDEYLLKIDELLNILKGELS